MLSESVERTEQIGEELGRTVCPPEIIWLYGDLGAGKTAFVRGLARGLGVPDRVTSPTFTIVNEYFGRAPLFHFDLYRLRGMDDLYDIGWEDYLARGGVCAVEWSERAGPQERGLAVHIETCPEGRVIRIDRLGD